MTHPFDLPPKEYDKLALTPEMVQQMILTWMSDTGWALEQDYENWRKDAELAKRPVIECSRCVAPGNCCKAIPISLLIPNEIVTPHGAAKYMSEKGTGFQGMHPFVALRPGHADLGGRTWLWSCTALQADGLCGMYDDRPDLCRTYEPGVDGLCVHMRGDDGHPIIPQKPKE